MAKVFIEETTLTAIGDAIREKTGGSDLIAPGAMPAEIKSIVSGGGGEGGLPEEALVVTGNCTYRFAHNGWNWLLEGYGDQMTTSDVYHATNMFAGSDRLTNIPFDINFRGAGVSSSNDLSYMFQNCFNLTTLPALNNPRPDNMAYIFSNCNSLKSIPDDWTDTWDWSKFESMTSAYLGNMTNRFADCHNLRSIPSWNFLHTNPYVTYNFSYLYNGFYCCYALEKIEGIRIPANVTWTSNGFYDTFKNCYRLKSVTFDLQPDGSPYVHNIKSQTIDLTTAGYVPAASKSLFLNKCPDFTETNIIDNYDKWEAYFGDPFADKSVGGSGNGFALGLEYSTFTRTAAKRLFKTLPDVTQGSSNVIKLSRSAGSAMKAREAMTNLTEEEIAVATARGWTVTLS